MPRTLLVYPQAATHTLQGAPWLRRLRAMRGWAPWSFARSVAVGLSVLSVGCTMRSDLMATTGAIGSGIHPEPEHALLLFVRPSSLGFAIHPALYDGDTLIGISSAQTAVAYQATPGPHRFMVVSEAADFLDAELIAGRTYFVTVEPRIGVWRARFSLLPLEAHSHNDEAARLEHMQVMGTTDRAAGWDRENRGSVLEKKDAYLRKWLAKPATDRPVLRPDDGL